MTRSETVRYSATEDRRRAREARDAARPLGPLRPDGRWAALLRAFGPAPTLTTGQLIRAVDDGRYPRWRLRQKVLRALHDMARLNWVAPANPGWTRTAVGAAALVSVDTASQQQESRP